jgi:hypothetical protein
MSKTHARLYKPAQHAFPFGRLFADSFLLPSSLAHSGKFLTIRNECAYCRENDADIVPKRDVWDVVQVSRKFIR